MKRVLIIGAGGHAQVVADILMRARDAGSPIEPLGYLDDRPDLQDRMLLGLPVFGNLAALAEIPHDALIVAIGDNAVRARLFGELTARGEQMIVAKHPSAVVAPDVSIGLGTMICANAVVNPGSVVGNNVILNTACSVDHHSCIGDDVHIAPGVHMGGEVQVGQGALVGIGATVMPRRQVGAWSIVGAGSLVSRDVPNHAVVTGVPATIRRLVQGDGKNGGRG